MDKVAIIMDIFPYVNMLLAIVIIFIEKRNVSTTLTWLMVLFFIPILGFILYFVFGQNLHKQKIFTFKKEEDNVLKKYMLRNKELVESSKTYLSEEMEDFKKMINMFINHNQAAFSENNIVEIYTNGDDKFKALLEAIDNSKKQIHIDYYAIKSDGIGTQFRDALVKKAKEGVEVKLLYDQLGSRMLRKSFFKPLVEAGGKYAVFFPSILKVINFRLNYRNHRKIAIIDNNIGFIGGFNIGDEYLGKNKKFGFWRDTHIKIEGGAVSSLQLRFLLDWRYATKEIIDLNLNQFNLPEYFGNIGMQIVSSGPDSEWEYIKYGFLSMIENAKENIYIQTPYLILDDSIRESLKIAAISGVNIKIMIPNKPDHPFVYWATYYNAGDLLRAGVKVYTYEKGFLHSKTIVVDKKVTSVGTSNMDIRSFKLDFEVNAFIYNKKTAAKLAVLFEEDLNDCIELTTEKYNNRGIIIKLKESISRLLSPIL
ncbi:MAG: cardiolipin synthase [Vulcanibacillus sp.]